MPRSALPDLVTPFVGERYSATGKLGALIAPPYDVIGPARRAELAARDAANIVHVILPEGRDRYHLAAKALDGWRDRGTLERDTRPGVTVVEQRFQLPDGRDCVRTGVIAGVHVEAYEAGRVKPHEKTHAGPKEDRLALMRATRATLETIFLLSRDRRGHLRRRLEGVTKHDPTAVTSLDGVAIRVWTIGGVQAAEVARAAGEGPLYIADGHHRFETANAYRAENDAASRIPGLIVPLADPGLVVLPTHRLIVGSAPDTSDLLAEWRQAWSVTERAVGDDPHALLAALPEDRPSCAVVLPGDRVYVVTGLRPDPDHGPHIAEIERAVVTPLREACGTNAAVSFTPDAAEATATVGSGDAMAAVLVNPTPVTTLLRVADAGGIMPPKSTYFAPKVPSGLVVMTHS